MLFPRDAIPRLSPAQAREGADAGELLLVDVREHDERLELRPAGSRHVPLGELPDRLAELPHDRTVAFICRSGARSAMAARMAIAHDLRVADVDGGLTLWHAVGLPTETGPERTENDWSPR
jgi:rhodanese-related sulfurtransferase